MSVKFRMVTTSFEVKCRKPGGKTVRECIEDANARLTVLEPTLLPLIADRVTQIEALIQPFKTRPSQEALNQVHRLADECLGYCVAIKRPGLAGSLRTVCKLADLLEGNAVWKPGAFLPAIHMIRATLQGGADLNPGQAARVRDGSGDAASGGRQRNASDRKRSFGLERLRSGCGPWMVRELHSHDRRTALGA